MKNNIIILLLIIALVVGSYKLGSHYNKDTSYQNIEQILKKSNEHVIRVTRRELRNIVLHNDSVVKHLMNSVKLKPRNIRNIIKNNYSYNYVDTVVIVKKDSINNRREILYAPDSCLSVNIEISKDTAFIKSIDVSNEITNVLYKRRIGRRGNKTIFPFGHINYGIISTQQCSGITKVQELKIQKR